MEKQELTELFSESFPFWEQIDESDRETFCRSANHV